MMWKAKARFRPSRRDMLSQCHHWVSLVNQAGGKVAADNVSLHPEHASSERLGRRREDRLAQTLAPIMCLSRDAGRDAGPETGPGRLRRPGCSRLHVLPHNSIKLLFRVRHFRTKSVSPKSGADIFPAEFIMVMVSLLILDYLIWIAFEGDFDHSVISPCLGDMDIEPDSYSVIRHRYDSQHNFFASEC